jgi:hypothetical protein
MGLKYGLSNIGGAFARGGLGAGMGALGGGLAGAAMGFLPYYAAGKAFGAMGESAYGGVQNFQDTRRMVSQYFEPQYGQPGTTFEGKPAAGMIKGITSFMHELASEDVMTSMKDMRRLMDRAGSMGMLQGVGDANQFKERFRSIVNRTKTVAQILGTTLDEAMPLVNQLQQMGMWTAKDVMGVTASIKAAGPGGAQAMMGSIQQGAQISHAMGGTLASGARLGQQLFGQVNAATRLGVFSQEDIMNITGGVGGAEGQRMVGGAIQGVMARFGQGAMGRMMMAGLGEIKEGAYTGRMDEAMLAKFQRGEIGVAELEALGRKRTQGNQNTMVSFFNKAGRLGQSMVEQGGMSAVTQALQQVMMRAGYADKPEDTQNKFLQMMTGSDQVTADAMQKLMGNASRIQAEEERRVSAAMEDSFRKLYERRNKSLAGLKDALGHSYRKIVGGPIEKATESVTMGLSESFEALSNRIMGRVQAAPALTLEQEMRISSSSAYKNLRGASLESIGIRGVGQSYISGGFAERVIGTIRGDMTKTDALMATGLRTRGGVAGANDVTLANGRVAAWEDVQTSAKHAFLRANQPTIEKLFGGESPAKRQAIEKVKARLQDLYYNPEISSRLKSLRDKNPEEHQREVIRLLRSDPSAREAMDELGRSAPGALGEGGGDASALAIAQSEMGANNARHAVDFGKRADATGWPSDKEGMDKKRRDIISAMASSTGKITALGVIGSAAVAGPVGLGAYLLSKKGGGASARAAIEAAVAKFDPEDIKAWATGKGRVDNAFSRAINTGDATAVRLNEMLQGMSPEERAAFASKAGELSTFNAVALGRKKDEEIKAAATAEGPIRNIRGVSSEVTSKVESARKLYEEGKIAEADALIGRTASGDLTKQEMNLLMSGRGGVAGRQIGRVAALKGMGEMSGAEFEKFRNRLASSAGGADVFSDPAIQKRLDEILRDNKVSRSEASELRKLGMDRVEALKGRGGERQKTDAEIAQEKFVTATGVFAAAVDRFSGKEAPADVKQEPTTTPAPANSSGG